MTINKPVFAGQLLDSLYWSVRDGKSIDNIPGLLEQLLAEDIWREVYVEKTERVVTYDRFEDFITTPPPEGLGTKPPVIKRLIGDNLEALNLLDAALQGKPGKTWDSRTVDKNTVYNINNNNERPAGTSRQYGIRRLRKDRPDLLQRVLDGELSVNQAMIEAGWRRKQLVVMKDVDLVINLIKREFSPEEVRAIGEELLGG